MTYTGPIRMRGPLRIGIVLSTGGLAASLSALTVVAQGVADDTSETLRRAGAYVEQYYSRAQQIVGVETITVDSVSRDMSTNGFGKRFVYDLRIEWSAANVGTKPEATLLRELRAVNGRPPKPGQEIHCLAPKETAPDPLTMFLPDRQEELVFTPAGIGRIEGRTAQMFDYRERAKGPDVVTWDRDCFSLELPGRVRGRAWIEPDTGAVWRIDESMAGPFEVRVPKEQQQHGTDTVFVFERSAVSIRYRPVTFHDPDELILLPASIESLAMTRSGGTRRRQIYSGYRRYVTEGRILP